MKRGVYAKRILALDAEERVGPALKAYKAKPTGQNMRTLKSVLRGWETALRAWRQALQLTSTASRPAVRRALARAR